MIEEVKAVYLAREESRKMVLDKGFHLLLSAPEGRGHKGKIAFC